MTNDYKELLPKGILFNLRQIDQMSLIKIAMAKKLITNGQLAAVKIGNKIHVSRIELIRFLEEKTIRKPSQEGIAM